jgi:hypothetical protein
MSFKKFLTEKKVAFPIKQNGAKIGETETSYSNQQYAPPTGKVIKNLQGEVIADYEDKDWTGDSYDSVFIRKGVTEADKHIIDIYVESRKKLYRKVRLYQSSKSKSRK